MGKYILTCCYERSLEKPKFFNTHEEASRAMKVEYDDMLESLDDDFEREYSSCTINDTYAEIRTSDWDCDWYIFVM